MIRLTNGTTDLVSLITGQNGAKTVAAFTDTTATTWAGLNEVHSITSATTTTIVGTPAASTIREIDFINIYNTFAGSHAITVQLSVSATLYILINITLLQNECLQYTHAGGWCCLDVNGNRKEATASNFTNITASGTAVISGQASLNGGVNLTSVAGTSFETGTTSSTFTLDGSGGTSSAKTLTWKRVGNWVTLNIPLVTATSGTGSVSFASNTAIVAAARPASTQYASVYPVANNGASVNQPGLVIINTNGTFDIRRDPASTAFTNSSVCGINGNTSIEYFIG